VQQPEHRLALEMADGYAPPEPIELRLPGPSGAAALALAVANEALAGRTNREIAQALFVTPKAVEFHLANTYRKLGIEGRGGLAEAMGSPSGEPAEAIP
jgi:DNA-binding CsgD family transcriptional regulator